MHVQVRHQLEHSECCGTMSSYLQNSTHVHIICLQNVHIIIESNVISISGGLRKNTTLSLILLGLTTIRPRYSFTLVFTTSST